MKTLLTISTFLLIVYGEDTDTEPGYFYPSPSIQETPQTNPLTENIDINRFVYFFKAPPSEKKPIKKPVIKIPPPKKNYKIIFIQAPEPPAPVLPELPVIPKDEEKTIVYVLNKKPEEQPTVFLPTPKPTKPTSPEVYFINYGLQKNSTPAEHHPQVSGEPEAPTTDESPRQYITPSTEAPSSPSFKIPSHYLPPAPQYGLQGTLDIPEAPTTDESPRHYITPSTEAPSSPSFKIPSQYLPQASQYDSHGTVDIPAEALPKKSELSSYLPPKTSYGVPIKKEVLNKPSEEQPTVFLPTPQVSGEPEAPETDESPRRYITPSSKAPSSPPFQILSQYLPPAPQYGLQGTLDVPAQGFPEKSQPSSRYLPPKTSYGVPIEEEASSKLSTKNSYGEPIETDDSYQGQVRNSRSALKTVEGFGTSEPYYYFQRKSAV
ncbi:unnamed protein product [Phaedon cochleariae]|uniref:DUF243 domain-containing protein n=1 Tax=Phaedon cochleariae TaxID=80249 RepID=A0A9P0DW56_PHACE|nr:unnamed protein product [Phaedon cochleariae]